MLETPGLEVRDLRLVSAISSRGTTTAAARVLGITQSAVSHQLRNLEERLGREVFTREGRRLVLSEAGQRLLDFADRMLPEFDSLGRVLQHESLLPKQQLRIATECYTAYHWFPRTSRALLRMFPDVELTIVPEATGDPRTALEQNRLELAFCIEPTPRGGSFQKKKAFTDEMVLVTSPRHPLARREWVTGDALIEEHLILYDNQAARSSRIPAILFPRGNRPKNISRLPLTEAICEMVRAEMGVSVLPDWSVAPYLRRGELSCTRLTRRGIQRDWVGLFQGASPLAPAVRALLDLIGHLGGTQGHG